MKKHHFDFITIYYESQDHQYLELFEDACRKSVRLINQFTGLPVPKHCKVHILRSWQKLYFHSDISILSILIRALIFPMWFHYYYKRWPYIGGIALPRINTFGVKPPPIFESPSNDAMTTAQIRDKNKNRRVQTAICHELTHIFSRQLNLPFWLNEGLALLLSDCFVGVQMIRPITIAFIKVYQNKTDTKSYTKWASNSMNDIAYQYLRGYWMLRFLLRDHPLAFSELLQKKRSRRDMVPFLAEVVGIPISEFWQKIDDVLFDAFPDGYERDGYPPVTMAGLMRRENEN